MIIQLISMVEWSQFEMSNYGSETLTFDCTSPHMSQCINVLTWEKYEQHSYLSLWAMSHDHSALMWMSTFLLIWFMCAWLCSWALHSHTYIVFSSFFVLHIHTSCCFLHAQILFHILMPCLFFLVYGKLILLNACVYLMHSSCYWYNNI